MPQVDSPRYPLKGSIEGGVELTRFEAFPLTGEETRGYRENINGKESRD